MTVQVGLCQTWWETPKTSFLASRLIFRTISSTLNNDFFSIFLHTRAPNSSHKWDYFKFQTLIQSFVVALITCKNEDRKMQQLCCEQSCCHYKSMEIFQDTKGQVTAVCYPIQSRCKLNRDIIVVLVTCKNFQ